MIVSRQGVTPGWYYPPTTGTISSSYSQLSDSRAYLTPFYILADSMCDGFALHARQNSNFEGEPVDVSLSIFRASTALGVGEKVFTTTATLDENGPGGTGYLFPFSNAYAMADFTPISLSAGVYWASIHRLTSAAGPSLERCGRLDSVIFSSRSRFGRSAHMYVARPSEVPVGDWELEDNPELSADLDTGPFVIGLRLTPRSNEDVE